MVNGPHLGSSLQCWVVFAFTEWLSDSGQLKVGLICCLLFSTWLSSKNSLLLLNTRQFKQPPGDKVWSILLMVLARRDWPYPPISPAVYLTSFGQCCVSKIRQRNNNVQLSTYGEVMKERGMEWREETWEDEHRSGELQLILELGDLQSPLLFCEVTEGDSPKKQSKHFILYYLFTKQKTGRLDIGIL